MASRTANAVRLDALQRARILAAIGELVYQRGPAGVTVGEVVARACVSRRTFYELYADCDACLAALFEHALARAATAMLPADPPPTGRSPTGRSPRALPDEADAGDGWATRIRTGLGTLLELFDREPATARLLIVDALAGGPKILARRARVLDALVDAVHAGGAHSRGRPARRPPKIVAEGAVGAVLAILHARLCQPAPGHLTPLRGRLAGIVVLPYLGPDAAVREAASGGHVRRVRPTGPPPDPLRQLDIRLTYRTVRVLAAIAQLGDGDELSGRKGPSSREVGNTAGVPDQGQISKLLARLQRQGLIVNAVSNPGRGVPNAWRLTARGCEVERAIWVQAGGSTRVQAGG